MSLDYEAQRREKYLEFAARWRAAGLPPAPIDWVRSQSPLVGYRNRVRCQVTPDGQVRFFNPEKGDACPVLDPSVRAGVELAKRIALEHPAAMHHFVALEIRGSDSFGRAAVRYRRGLEAGSPAPAAASDPDHTALLAAWPGPWLVAGLDNGSVPCQRWSLPGGVWMDVPLDAFMQVNTDVNRLLIDHVRRGIVKSGARSFADLFMGAGNFALPLLAQGLQGYAVEVHAGAVRAAVQAAQAQGLSFVLAEAAEAAVRATAWVTAGLTVDVVIADPPRAGLGGAVSSIARLARRSVVLCSCNSKSLVCDVAMFLAAGFRVEQVALFDMFPQTPHLESVVWLERSQAQRSSNIFS